MSAENENLKDKLQSIKQNLEKKLSESNDAPVNKAEKNTEKAKVSQIETKFEVVEKVTEQTTEPPVITDEASKEKNETSKKIVAGVIAGEADNSKPVKEDKHKKAKPKKKKKKRMLVPLIVLAGLIAALVYVFSLKDELENSKKDFEQAKKEAIDYKPDAYFKEVPDELDDEEMQDFAVYKDVPEVVAEENTQTKILSQKENNDINRQIKESEKNRATVQNTKVASQNNSQTVKKSTTTSVKTNQNNTGNTNDTNNPVSSVKENNTENNENQNNNNNVATNTVFSDYIKVVGLEYKNGKPTIPKKAKKTNAFKIRIRLKKNQITTSEKDVDVMLVVKDSNGKTLKIDSKKINFGSQRSKVLYLEFYEVFTDKLQTGKEYTFSVFADKKLIKTGRKTL